MHELSVIRFVGKQANGDCGIAALAMYLDKSYEDIFAMAAVVLKSKTVHRSGMYATELIRIASQFNMKLCKKRTWDFETAFGLMIVDLPNMNRHFVLLRDGMIYDPEDFTVSEVDTYTEQHGAKPMLLLTEKC